jgi:hypothetical protein
VLFRQVQVDIIETFTISFVSCAWTRALSKKPSGRKAHRSSLWPWCRDLILTNINNEAILT